MAVTKAQIAAGRAANQAYKAAQASGNTSQASNIVSNAAKALGVSSGSSAYQSAMSKASSIQAPKIEQPKVDSLPNIQQPQQQQNYNLQNLQNLQNPNQRSNIFGDIYGNERQTYTGEGIKLSTGDIVKDKTQLGEIKNINDYMKFGKAAQDIESKEKGFIERRNDAIIMDIFKSSPKVTQENVDKLVIDYIKAKDKDGSLYTGDRGEADVQNTLASIKSRMGYIPSERDLLTEKATDAYDREITDIKSQYDAEKSAFMKAGAIEDRYTNFNEVNDKIQSTLEAAGKHRAENLYTGMPTDEQISEIAQGLGQDFNSTKKILEGRGFEDLEMQGEFKEKSERPFQRAFEDMELNRNRSITDVQTKHERTQTALNEQIDDVKTQMERSIRMGEKAGALSGGLKSSGYVMGLDNIRNDALKNIDRLELRSDWDTEDTAMIKGRITEDFNIGMTRIKQDLETQMNEIKTSNGAALSQYLNQYAPSSSELTRKLNELEDTFAVKSQAAFSNYMANLRGITDTMTYDTEKALQLQGMKQQLQQTNVKNMLANNGAALAGINYNDLQTMLQSGDISPSDYTAMVGNMKTLGISSLQSMGNPAPQDLALYNQMLEQGMTPQQAISSVTSANPSRFSQTATGGDWKLDSNSGQFYRTGANGQLEFSQFPDQQQTQQQVPTNYTQASQSQIQKGGVFLYNYKDGDKAPRNGWCGQFVNDYLKSMGITNENLFIDPIKDKARYVNSQTPTEGSVMIMDSKTSPDNGHVAVVTKVHSNGNVDLKEANRGGDGKIHVRTNVNPNNMGVKVHGYFDPRQQGGIGQPTTASSNQYKDFTLGQQYSTLKPQNQTIVKGLLDYNISLPPRNVDYNKIIGATMEANPEWSDVTYKERYDFKKVWNKSLIGGGNLSKVATAVQHLGELEHLATQLEGQSNLQAKNTIVNRAKEKLGNPNITSFDTAAAALTSELAGAYKGNASPSEADREERAKIVGKQLSPKQLSAYVDTAAKLLFGKINTEAEAYYRTMGEEPASIFTKDGFDYLKSKGLNVDYYFKSPERDGITSGASGISGNGTSTGYSTGATLDDIFG